MCIALSLPFGSDMEVAQNPPPVIISCLRSSMQARESMDQPLLNVVHLSLTSGFTLITQSNNTAKKRNKTNWASYYSSFRVSLVAHSVRICLQCRRPPAAQKTQVRSVDREDPLEKEVSTHSTILAQRIPWTEEPGGLQSIGLQRVRHD